VNAVDIALFGFFDRCYAVLYSVACRHAISYSLTKIINEGIAPFSWRHSELSSIKSQAILHFVLITLLLVVFMIVTSVPERVADCVDN